MLKELNVIHKIVLSMLILGVGFFVFQTIKCHNIRFSTVEDELIEMSESTERVLIGTAIIVISEIIEIILLIKYDSQLAHKVFVGILLFLLFFGIFLMLLHLKTYFYMFTFFMNWEKIEEFDNFFNIVSNLFVGIISILTSGAGLILLKIIGHYLKNRQ